MANLPRVIDGAGEVTAANLLSNATGIPPEIASGLMGAANRLLGAGLEYPAAWIERATQGVRDKTEGKSLMSQALAEAAAQQAISDPELVRAAALDFMGGALRKHVNKRAVWEEAKYQIEKEVVDGDSRPTKEPSADWMNAFERYAEDASGDEMRSLWGKVLAGELRRKGCFSRQTMSFLAELDQTTAIYFESFCAGVVNNCAIRPNDGIEGALFDQLSELETVGLISGVSGFQSTKVRLSENGSFLGDMDTGLLIFGPNGQFVEYSCMALTRMGREAITLQTDRHPEPAMRRLAVELSKAPVTRIEMLKAVGKANGTFQFRSDFASETLFGKPPG